MLFTNFQKLKARLLVNVNLYKQISKELVTRQVVLVAVSKTKSIEEILELYNLGQRDFGENYVQELLEKFQQLPKDIRWHFIGHLQSNKVKLIAPFVSLIQSVDSEKLLKEINKEAKKNNRIIDCLLQIHIANEESKFGLNEEELQLVITRIFHTNSMNQETEKSFQNVCIKGLMGMASFTNDLEIVRKEFQTLKSLFDKYAQLSMVNCPFSILSMGMSGDYKIAIEEGSNMVRIGSLLFGKRNYASG
jgi:pyridoxal phosphate enzyme (YggS family)